METEKKSTHILLIDDDQLMLRVFSSGLAHAGFEVMQAHEGNEGREMARRLQPDLILLDLHMPLMGGVEVLSHLKDEEPTKNIPVVIFSNEDLSIEAETNLKELGAVGYIYKSMPMEEVVEKVRAVLGIASE